MTYKETKEYGQEWIYPVDNSYAYSQSTGKNEYLAGFRGCKDEHMAKPVRVILDAFKMMVSCLGILKSMEDFVVVEDEKGDRHVVLDNFRLEKEKPTLDWLL